MDAPIEGKYILNESLSNLTQVVDKNIDHYNNFAIFMVVFCVLGGGRILSTTDVDLFLNTMVVMPSPFDISVPLSMFYVFFPIIVFLSHFYLLFGARKVSNSVFHLKSIVSCDVYVKLFGEKYHIIGEFASILVNKPSLSRKILFFLVFFMIVFAPNIAIILSLVLFYRFQSEEITWIHRVICLSDSILVVLFSFKLICAARFVKMFCAFFSLCVFLYSVFMSFFIAVIPGERLEVLLDHFGVERHNYIDLSPQTGCVKNKYIDKSKSDSRGMKVSCVQFFVQNLALNIFGVNLRGNLILENFNYSEYSKKFHSSKYYLGNLGVGVMEGIAEGVPGSFMALEKYSDRSFKYMVVSGSDIRNSDFSRANFYGASFVNSIVLNSVFSYSNLSMSFVSGGDFSGSSFLHSQINGARLISSNFRNSVFHSSTAVGMLVEFIDFRNSSFSDAKIVNSLINFSEMGNSNFHQSIFRDTEISFSDLRGGFFEFSDFTGSHLKYSKVSYSDWTASVIGSVIFTNTRSSIDDSIIILRKSPISEINSFSWDDLRRGIIKNFPNDENSHEYVFLPTWKRSYDVNSGLMLSKVKISGVCDGVCDRDHYYFKISEILASHMDIFCGKESKYKLKYANYAILINNIKVLSDTRRVEGGHGMASIAFDKIREKFYASKCQENAPKKLLIGISNIINGSPYMSDDIGLDLN